jgi:hypothetical protein
VRLPKEQRRRRLIVERVVEQGWTLAQAAEAAGVSVRTVSKWLARSRAEGADGLVDRSSAPQRVPSRTPEERVELIALLRAAPPGRTRAHRREEAGPDQGRHRQTGRRWGAPAQLRARHRRCPAPAGSRSAGSTCTSASTLAQNLHRRRRRCSIGRSASPEGLEYAVANAFCSWSERVDELGTDFWRESASFADAHVERPVTQPFLAESPPHKERCTT